MSYFYLTLSSFHSKNVSFCVSQKGAGTERLCLRENITVPAAEEHHPEFAGTFVVSVLLVTKPRQSNETYHRWTLNKCRSISKVISCWMLHVRKPLSTASVRWLELYFISLTIANVAISLYRCWEALHDMISQVWSFCSCVSCRNQALKSWRQMLI